MRAVLTIVACAAFASPALAQATDTRQPQPLRGPSVPDAAESGKKSETFATKEPRKKTPQAQLHSVDDILHALDRLKGGANAISKDQQGQIDTIASDARAALAAYLAKHQDEVDSLVSLLRPSDRDVFLHAWHDGTPLQLSKRGFAAPGAKHASITPSDNAPTPAEKAPVVRASDAQAARAKLYDLYKARPSVEAVKEAIWKLLTPAQQQAADESLTALATKGGKPNRKGVRAVLDSLPAIPKDATPEQIINDPSMPQALRDRLRAATPAQREKLLSRLHAVVRKPPN